MAVIQAHLLKPSYILRPAQLLQPSCHLRGLFKPIYGRGRLNHDQLRSPLILSSRYYSESIPSFLSNSKSTGVSLFSGREDKTPKATDENLASDPDHWIQGFL